MGKAPAALWPPRFGAAIFDFDGTLANTAAIWHEVDVTFLKRRGHEVDDEYAQRLSALGFVDGARYTIARYGLTETVDEICAEWTRMSRELYQSTVRLRAGAQRYIEALRQAGIPCALATTNDASVLEHMQYISVRGLFDAQVYGRDVGRGKDHPDIYWEAARRLGANPADCIVFEDIVPAIRSAREAGMVACGVRAHDPSQRVEEAKEAANLWLESWTDIVLP